MLVLVMVGLVVLGPERLPGAIRWAASALRQARDYLSGVTSQLREDIDPNSMICGDISVSCRSYGE